MWPNGGFLNFFNNNSNNKEKQHPRKSRSRLPRWLRPLSCPEATTMSENKQESRSERIARYKEERKRQLAEQFSSIEPRKTNATNGTSSSDSGSRTNRAAKLRALAILSNGSSHPQGIRVPSLEKGGSSLFTASEAKPVPLKNIEKDKSSKRKSHLNRSSTSEEVPNDCGDPKSRRRARRFFPTEVLEQHPTDQTCSKDDARNRKKCDTTPPPLHTTATSTLHHNSPLSSCTTANSGSNRFKKSSSSSDKRSSQSTDKKSSTSIDLPLSAHMENARRGITPAFSEMGRYKPFPKRSATTNLYTSSPNRDKVLASQETISATTTTSFSDRETTRSYNFNSASRKSSASDNEATTTQSVAKRMEELTAITRETLARVEKLANTPKKDLRQLRSPSYKQESKTVKTSTHFLAQPSSILKKKTREDLSSVKLEPVPAPLPIAASLPVSILKRKVIQDDNSIKTDHSSTHTPPVTFSPNVVEPSTTKRKQGILKKRRSLDESSVMRHRSCSPDVANCSKNDSRSSILKHQKRRSSLEELRLNQSPEIVLHGILKRKPWKNEEEDHSLNSPQSILKRRSGASSAGSTGSTPHVSITTAVILAAAGGAEMVLQTNNTPSDTVKPILKKKSFSDEHSYSESSTETPRPILKKKSSTDTDDGEERPKPILKISRSSMDRETLDTGQDKSDMEVRPILKSSSSLRAESPRPRLSFCGDDGDFATNHSSARSRRSYTICADFNLQSNAIGGNRDEDRTLKKVRPLSVQELVMTFEQTAGSKGAIPKRSSSGNKRNSDRHRTQPVTSHELEQSLNLVTHNSQDHSTSFSFANSSSYSLESDGGALNSSWTNSLYSRSSIDTSSTLESFQSSFVSPSSPSCPKMSSDSAFQSLGDGLELETDEDYQKNVKPKLEPLKLADQMKAIADEAKKTRLGKGNAGLKKYSARKAGDKGQSRFSTQPVTFDEVQEAARLGTNKKDSEDFEACNLSLLDKIRRFELMVEGVNKRNVVSPLSEQRRFTFSGQPLRTIDEASQGRKGILKTTTSPTDRYFAAPQNLPPTSRFSRKKRDDISSKVTNVTSRVEKEDEGISSDNNSDSDDKETPAAEKVPRVYVSRLDEGSSEDGESSGGREVKSIFKNERGRLNLDFKKTLEGVLLKSKSQTMCGTFEDIPTSKKSPSSGLRRSHTHTSSVMPRSIADLRAKLQESGETGWKKRIPQNNNTNDELKFLKEKNRYNDELSEKTLLAAKKDELDTAAQQWKNRIEKSDAEKYTVAGKMEEKIKSAAPTINIPVVPGHKKSPTPKVFKGKSGTESSSTPSSPEKNSLFDLTRSRSVPYPPLSKQETSLISDKLVPRKVAVPKPDDFTFQTFFQSIEDASTKTKERLDVNPQDFDAIERHQLLVIKKNVQVQRRRGATRNPIRALAKRTDITNEYTEVITGIAERETKRLNIEKLAKNSTKALEALAGLASNEDFKSVALKKGTGPTMLLPWKSLMLFQIKGRRHVQTRLVEPAANSINEGDCFVLVTPSVVYNYVGAFSNVIEQSRAADVVNHIQKTNDMGCKSSKIVTITNRNSAPKAFWKLLGAEEVPETIDAGHPSEDETYESNVLHTNMIYTLKNNELVPYDNYWGSMPKIEMLQETSVLVFDFGSEMYVWSGKNAALEKKKTALRLAKEMWDEGYNYNDCTVCPLNIASILGDREQTELPLKSSKRPDWALFAKITQHRETVLFREKFLDWPDYSRIIRVKSDENVRQSLSGSYDIKPCDAGRMARLGLSEPDLVVDKHTHLGRGNQYFDDETNRMFEYDTLEIKAWRIMENTHEELDEKSIGQFYDTESYIYSWKYRQTVKGRELSGKPSKHAQVGRERCVFFCWHGSKSSISEKCTAAFLTVELDKENAPQVRVVQGFEPAAFLRLFDGGMVIHSGGVDRDNSVRLYITRGEIPAEIYLMEVPAKMSSLRSRTSFVIVDAERKQVTIWHGCKSSERKRDAAKVCAKKLISKKPLELFTTDAAQCDLEWVEVNEGCENEDVFDVVGNDRASYFSLLDSGRTFDYTVRVFAMSSVTGNFEATEVLCPHRSEFSSPYPFVQSELYSASQPALFLIDNSQELWLWQGWWPEKEDDDSELSDQTGSGAIRWQAERRAAMQTAVNYWKKKKKTAENKSEEDKEGEVEENMAAYLVWAGLEPLEFRNLFPSWEDRDDVAELNVKEGKIPGEKLCLRRELARLSRTTYPLSDILRRPLPEGVDPTQLEIYLSPDDFQELLSMTREEFRELPSWKQTALKKEKGLF